jgi:hypothetical protein
LKDWRQRLKRSFRKHHRDSFSAELWKEETWYVRSLEIILRHNEKRNTHLLE